MISRSIRKDDPSVDVCNSLVLRVESLVRKVKEADIKLPRFQRPFVWKRGDILDLWDSVYRGYPISSVLLWFTKEKLASHRTIGDLAVDERPEEYPTNYLLDGQQRLSTLCGVLFWDGKNPKSNWAVAFDLKTETFFHRTDAPLAPHHFPMNRLLETKDFIKECGRLHAADDADHLIEVAERLLNAVKDYKIAAVTLSNMDIDEVAPVFERINSSGRQLTVAELLVAATWSSEFDLSEEMEAIKQSLAPRGFDRIRNKTLLQSFSAATGRGINAPELRKLRQVGSVVLESSASTRTAG